MSHTSWCSRNEWDTLSTMVCSIPEEPDNVSKLELTISVLNCLMSRLPTPPTGALMTVELLQAFLAMANSSDQSDSQCERQQMAFAVIRFVNYVSHAYHVRESRGVQPVHKVAAQQNVPDWLVTLRHDAAHGDLPPAHLLRHALAAALQWTVANYWQQSPSSPGAPDSGGRSEPDAARLDRLRTALAGPRGKQMDKRLLLDCLSSQTLRRPALTAMADAMVTSYAECGDAAGSGQRHLTATQSWVSALRVVCRDDLLSDLLELLLTRPPTSELFRREELAAAALWVRRLATAAAAAARSGDGDAQMEPATPERGRRSPESAIHQLLVSAVGQGSSVHWSRLLEAALRHKNETTVRLLPLLMDSMSPPLPEKRRQLMLQLVTIATSAVETPPARPPVTVSIEQLRRLGVQLPATADDVPMPAPSNGATVAPPTDFGSATWRICADGPEWREATEIGRLPWQQETPLLLDAEHWPADGSA